MHVSLNFLLVPVLTWLYVVLDIVFLRLLKVRFLGRLKVTSVLQPSKVPAACVWSPCCDVLRHVGCCWLKFETGQIFHQTFVYAACCSRLARFVQQCCAWACALVRFSTRNMSQHVATGWPNACNMLRPTMLRSVAFKCCDRLAGTCKCCASNGGI